MTESPLELLLLKEIGETCREICRLERQRVKILARLDRLRRRPKKKPRKG